MTKVHKAKPIAILPTSTPDEAFKRMEAAGYVVLLCDEPDKIKIVIPGDEIVANDLLMSALTGLSSTYAESHRAAMVLELFRRLKANEERKAKP